MLARRPWLIPALLFALILLHGSLIGLTDDEAYYWVLAQKPAAGYAYHPPGVALMIALSQFFLGWLAGPASVFVVRFPAAVCAAGMVALGLRWMRQTGEAPIHPERLAQGGLVLVALPGIFALSWMMVPDLPLFLFWTLAFTMTWEICQNTDESRLRSRYLWVSIGIAGAILSKYSGVLGAASAGLAILFWAPRERKFRGLIAVIAGGVIAAIPIIYWNATHEWMSILYQVRERHGGAQLSLLRYARFWAIEWVLAGPALVIFGVLLLRNLVRGQAARPEKYALLWAAPGGAIFFAQPLWADFKPHWALIVWWPLILAMGWAVASGGVPKLARWQRGYGFGLVVLVLMCCHFPLLSWATRHFGGREANPLLDVTNDLYGWSELRAFIEAQGGPEAGRLPILASRYQTASQAAFAMGKGAPVTMLPRDLKAMDEWPRLEVASSQGPEWPRLSTAVLFVADHRYSDGPEFGGANCFKIWTLEKRRWDFPAKTIYIWKCEPTQSP